MFTAAQLRELQGLTWRVAGFWSEAGFETRGAFRTALAIWHSHEIGEPATFKALASLADADYRTVKAAVDEAVARGLVRVVTNPADRRFRVVELTAAGFELANTIRQQYAEAITETADRIRAAK